MMHETSAESISNFMHWAAERIAREVEENEKIEEETGVRNYQPPTVLGRSYNDNEKVEAVGAVDFYRDRGMKLLSACEEYGIHHSSYRKWKKQYNLPEYKYK
tara:strand:- start:203 stop:508 length:306 start_codon:yes stop_codon:yes gene_type:complete